MPDTNGAMYCTLSPHSKTRELYKSKLHFNCAFRTDLKNHEELELKSLNQEADVLMAVMLIC
jgi:hypothetical protein